MIHRSSLERKDVALAGKLRSNTHHAVVLTLRG